MSWQAWVSMFLMSTIIVVSLGMFGSACAVESLRVTRDVAKRARKCEHPSAVLYGTLQQQHILLSIDFSYTVHWTKKFVFIYRTYIREELARPDPTMTLFDASCLSQFIRYKLEILTQDVCQFWNSRIKFWIWNLFWFPTYSVSR